MATKEQLNDLIDDNLKSDSGIKADAVRSTLKAVVQELPDVAYTQGEKDKLQGIQAGATANASNADLRDRGTHTGQQAISTVTGLQGALDGKAAAIHTHAASDITQDSTHRFVTDTEKSTWNAGTGGGSYTAGAGIGIASNVISLADERYTTAEKSKLAGVATGATANSTDAQLRDRSTHTGTQAISTVTGLQTALDGKQATQAGKGLSTNDYTTIEKNKLSLLSVTYVGTFISLAALQTAYPTGQPGYEAIVDTLGSDAIKYIWDDTDNEWVTSTPGTGASTFAELGGSPNDNTALAAAFAGKANTSHTHSAAALTQSGATDGQALVWDAGTSHWVPGDIVDQLPADVALTSRTGAAAIQSPKTVDIYESFPYPITFNDGRVRAYWRRGVEHVPAGPWTWAEKQPDGTWSAPVETGYKTIPAYPAGYFGNLGAGGRLFLTIADETAVDAWTVSGSKKWYKSYVIYSDDYGATWSAPFLLQRPSGFQTLDLYGPMVQMPGGELYITGYTLNGWNDGAGTFAGDEASVIYQSTDNGATWAYKSTIRQVTIGTTVQYVDEGSICIGELGPTTATTKMLAITRGAARLSQSFSLDGGATWFVSPAIGGGGDDNGRTGGTGGTQATAHATISGGAVTAIVPDVAGAGYTGRIAVYIYGGGGSGAAATATNVGGVPSYTLVSGGSGYTSAPTVLVIGEAIYGFINQVSPAAQMYPAAMLFHKNRIYFTCGFRHNPGGQEAFKVISEVRAFKDIVYDTWNWGKFRTNAYGVCLSAPIDFGYTIPYVSDGRVKVMYYDNSPYSTVFNGDGNRRLGIYEIPVEGEHAARYMLGSSDGAATQSIPTGVLTRVVCNMPYLDTDGAGDGTTKFNTNKMVFTAQGAYTGSARITVEANTDHTGVEVYLVIAPYGFIDVVPPNGNPQSFPHVFRVVSRAMIAPNSDARYCTVDMAWEYADVKEGDVLALFIKHDRGSSLNVIGGDYYSALFIKTYVSYRRIG